jgi:exonuclease III
VQVKLPSGIVVHAYNVHLKYIPYQPYQFASIPFGDFPFITTEKEAIHWANKARGDKVTEMLSELETSLEAGAVCFLTGDFNEPSHLDWTAESAEMGRVPIKVAYPSTQRVTEAGMKDGFRAIHKDPIEEPGLTWTPTTNSTDPKDRHDRIDFVFSSLPDSSVKQAGVVGESNANAHVVVSPWPTDHRGVVAEYHVEPERRVRTQLPVARQ